MGVVLSALQASDRSAELSTDLDKFECLGSQRGVFEEQTGDVVEEPELATTVTADVECSDMFQKTGSGTLEDMIEVAAETNVKVVWDDNPGEGLKQHRYVPILHDSDTDNDLPIGAKTWGDKLALDTLQRADSWFDGDNLHVASGGS